MQKDIDTANASCRRTLTLQMQYSGSALEPLDVHTCAQDRWNEAHLGHSLQVELAEGSLEASLALCNVARHVVPVQLHVATHIGQVQDLLQAGPCFWLLLDQRLHQLLQIIAEVPWNWRELPTAARDFHFQSAVDLFLDLMCQQFTSCKLVHDKCPTGEDDGDSVASVVASALCKQQLGKRFLHPACKKIAGCTRAHTAQICNQTTSSALCRLDHKRLCWRFVVTVGGLRSAIARHSSHVQSKGWCRPCNAALT